MNLCSEALQSQFTREVQVKRIHEYLTNFWLHEVKPIERELYITKNVKNYQVQHRIPLKNDLL